MLMQRGAAGGYFLLKAPSAKSERHGVVAGQTAATNRDRAEARMNHDQQL